MSTVDKVGYGICSAILGIFVLCISLQFRNLDYIRSNMESYTDSIGLTIIGETCYNGGPCLGFNYGGGSVRVIMTRKGGNPNITYKAKIYRWGDALQMDYLEAIDAIQGN